MLKAFLLNTLKLLFAGALVAWLVKSGKLDFNLLGQLQHHPLSLLAAIFLNLCNLWLISIRWRKVLKARTAVYLPLTGMVKVSWIGQFFSSVLPGSVSGDLVKILYVQHLNPNFTKKFIFASILIDRVMGLMGLILLVGTSSLFFSSHILGNSPAMKPLLITNYVLAVGVITSLCLFFFCHGTIRKLFQKCQNAFLPQIWSQVISLWDDLTAIRSKVLKAVGISFTVQFLSVLTFWCLIHPFIQGQMDFREALAFIPLGLMTLALPVAPSGLGVGHAIFQKLFQFSGIENGASLFNIYFFVSLTVNLMGIVPWVLSRKK